MSIASELASICKDLRLLGESELTKEALYAYAAITDTENPRADLSYSVPILLRSFSQDLT